MVLMIVGNVDSLFLSCKFILAINNICEMRSFGLATQVIFVNPSLPKMVIFFFYVYMSLMSLSSEENATQLEDSPSLPVKLMA